MGLLDLIKRKPKPEPKKERKPAPKPKAKPKRVPDPEEVFEVGGIKMYFPKPGDEPDTNIYESFNLTPKMVLVDVPHRDREDVDGLIEGVDYLKVEDVDVWEQDGVIRGLHEGEVLFEIPKRSKAYSELLQYVGRRSKRFTIWEESGSYGKYYQARLWFDTVYYE